MFAGFPNQISSTNYGKRYSVSRQLGIRYINSKILQLTDSVFSFHEIEPLSYRFFFIILTL